ncbi:MAG: CCA tRNA nucleotidyltransferase [Candidatus Bathyarchaeia archaeon]
MTKETLTKVLKTVLKRETPTETESSKLLSLTRKISEKLAEECFKRGIEGDIRVEGSFAKDTWLRSKKEADIFLLAPLTHDRQMLENTFLEAAESAVRRHRTMLRYAEHPYLEVYIGDATLNLVPAYNVEKGKWKSATDRTQFHTTYITRRLNSESQKAEVRLLKRFLTGLGVYGADIKTGGISGYLAELLILAYGKFLSALHATKSWQEGQVIDPENFYRGRETDVQALFDSPLIVIDPVDERRNVASAVRKASIDSLRAAAKFFLLSPSLRFFYPPVTNSASTNALVQRGTKILVLRIFGLKLVPDVLWGQLNRSIKALSTLLIKNDFNVLRSTAFSDDATQAILIFELEESILPMTRKHFGPPIASKGEEAFLSKHTRSPDRVSGPWIDNGRWAVLVRRPHRDALRFLKEKLKDGGVTVGIASHLAFAIKRGKFEISYGHRALVRTPRQLRKTFTDFLDGKPSWLPRNPIASRE